MKHVFLPREQKVSPFVSSALPHAVGLQRWSNVSAQQGSRWASGGWEEEGSFFSRKVIKNYFHSGYLPHSLVTESIQHRNGTELNFHFCFAVHL